jgi:hypothetical protein
MPSCGPWPGTRTPSFLLHKLLTPSGSVSARGQLRRRASLPTLNAFQVLRGLEERETVLGVCGEAGAAIARPRHAAPRASAFASRHPKGAGRKRARVEEGQGAHGSESRAGGLPKRRGRLRHQLAIVLLPQRTSAAESPALPPVLIEADRSPCERILLRSRSRS